MSKRYLHPHNFRKINLSFRLLTANIDTQLYQTLVLNKMLTSVILKLLTETIHWITLPL